MQVKVFCATDEDENLYRRYLSRYDKNGCVHVTFTAEDLDEEHVRKQTKDIQAVVILTRCVIHENVAKILKENGVKYVLTRSAGYDHIDIQALERNGIKASNVPLYSPNAIAEYVCMTVLMILRKMKRQLRMIERNDYRLTGIRGRELRNMTIGIVGTGRIGCETVKIMSGFSGRILAYDMYPKDDMRLLASYVSLEELYKNSDIIIYHCPLTEENYHMVNENAISKMKQGVILVNPARGGLWDYRAVADAVESGKIAGVVTDVYESEKSYLRKKVTGSIIEFSSENSALEELRNRENVIYTAHSAFYTDTAIENMIETTVENLVAFARMGSCSCLITGK